MDPHGIYEAIVAGRIDQIQALIRAALDDGVPPLEIISKHLMPGMGEVGDRFERQEYFLPEMLAAAEAMKRAMAVLGPHLTEGDLEPRGVVVAGTVQGDLHDIGKNLVCMMLEGAGFRVSDLGTDVPAHRFRDAARREGADIIAMSALISSTKKNLGDIVRGLRAAGVQGHPKLMIGGAPITQEFCDQIEADGYAPDAAAAVRKARELLGHD
jgi:5-methyltetrahydrofolate--homocysteine methyltransferase